MILVDTGPIVALLNRQDRYHRWTTDQMAILRPPLHTCESVLSEGCFRLQQAGLDASGIFELIDRKVLVISFELKTEFSRVADLMRKYSNLPIDLADACLVAMAEKIPETRVLTLDGDFLIYRTLARQIIPVILPEEIRNRVSRRRKS
jgi:predicted nucleic acid-binding protein